MVGTGFVVWFGRVWIHPKRSLFAEHSIHVQVERSKLTNRNPAEDRYEKLKAQARFVRSNFVRDIKSEVIALNDGEILVLTRLLDEHHDMTVAMLIDENLTIQDFGVRMERIPYPVCFDAEEAYEELKGLFVFQRGIIKEIRKRVDRTAGCTHISELIEASLRALFAGLYSVRRKVDLSKILSREEFRQLNIGRPFLVDTCRAFRKIDEEQEQILIAADKIRAAGYDPDTLDPMRSTD